MVGAQENQAPSEVTSMSNSALLTKLEDFKLQQIQGRDTQKLNNKRPSSSHLGQQSLDSLYKAQIEDGGKNPTHQSH